MRLSDAMLLGSMTMRTSPGNWNRCALGAAATAVGAPRSKDRVGRIRDHWPWLSANYDERLVEIATLFDLRVCDGDMTFEYLVAYVRSIEPPCGDCCTFDCCCERVQSIHAAYLADVESVLEIVSAA